MPVFQALVKNGPSDLLDLESLKVFTCFDVAYAANSFALRVVHDVGPAAAVAEPHGQLGLRLLSGPTPRGLQGFSWLL